MAGVVNALSEHVTVPRPWTPWLRSGRIGARPEPFLTWATRMKRGLNHEVVKNLLISDRETISSLAQRSPTMLRHALVAVVVVFLVAGGLLAADKEVKGKLVKVDVEKKILTINTDDGKKEYTVNADTKFIGPKGGESKDGIKDERLVAGAELKLVIAGNNKTVREVHLPEKKKK